MGYRQIGTNKKGEKKWLITVEQGLDVFGNRDRITKTVYGTVADAKIADAELTKKYYHKGKVANVKDLTFEEYSVAFLKKCEGNVGITTINNYKRLLRDIIPFIGHCKLSKITPQMLNTMYSKLKMGQRGKELSYNSMYDYYKIINVMFNQAILWEFVDTNPNKKANKPKKQKIERKFYDLEQIKQLLACLDNEPIKYKALITLALDSGARRGEIVALKWDDLDFNNRTLRIDNSLKVVNGVMDEKNAKTLSSKRTIVLSEATIEVLKVYKEWQDSCKRDLGKKWKNENRVFTDDTGGYMNPSTCYKIFTKITKKNGLEHIRFHDLRHTSASVLIHKGINFKAVSERLGHSSINITFDIYTHTFDKDKIESANTFDEIIKNA